MKRIYISLFGLVLFVGTVLLVLRTGSPPADPFVLGAVLGLLVAADLFVLGGLRAAYRVGGLTIRWYHLVGTAVVLIGLVHAGFALGSPALPSVGTVAGLVVGVAVVLVGIDLVRGGIHYDLSKLE